MNVARKKLRVMVVEDTITTSMVLKNVIESKGTMEVIRVVSNGEDAVRYCRLERPDLITMDIGIPKLNGLQATRIIMEEKPTPIVIISSLVNPKDQQISFDALNSGAVDVMPKPRDIFSESNEKARNQFVTHLENMAKVPVVTKWSEAKKAAMTTGRPITMQEAPFIDAAYKILVVGASTGGPAAMAEIFKEFKNNFKLPIVIVQHIAKGFVEGLVTWLAKMCELEIKIVGGEDTLRPGVVFFAPDDKHIEVLPNSRLKTVSGPPISGHRPSIDVLFNSVSRVYKGEAIGIILTGMGKDGASGLLEMKNAGALTIAQDEPTSIVYGMPKAAVEIGATKLVLPLERIGRKVNNIVGS